MLCKEVIFKHPRLHCEIGRVWYYINGAIKSVGFQPVARMSEAKYGKTTMSSIVPVFRFAHTGYLAE
ncbi:hypothetical protein CbuRSA461_07360 [Coxiella burnetii]|nr:hypothetical protein CbuRSA461_07360 [Coxiella burnetii]